MGKKGEIPEILTKVEKEISKRRKRDRKEKATFRDLLRDLKTLFLTGCPFILKKIKT